jgi:serine/threonine protein kinase
MAIVTELCSEGSLFEFMRTKQLTIHDKLILARQVVDGLRSINPDEPILRRDCPSRNVLIHRLGDEYIAKVDFGK